MADGMVALLPKDSSWCHIDIPHVTLIYIEDIDGLPREAFYEIALIVSKIALKTETFSEKVLGLKVFGDEEKVDVLALNKGLLLESLKKQLDYWDSGKFPVFKPHATIGPEGSSDQKIPLMLTFDRITIGWGEDYFTFRLKPSE